MRQFLLLVNEGEWKLTQNFGNELTKSQWENIKRVMDEFYLDKNDEEIERNNEENIRKANEGYFDYDSTPKKKKPGCVYFIGCNETGVKIGFSTNVKGRLNTLNIASPYKLELIETIECANYEQVEKWAHEYFAERRMNSEWFDITEEEIRHWIGGLTRE